MSPTSTGSCTAFTAPGTAPCHWSWPVESVSTWTPSLAVTTSVPLGTAAASEVPTAELVMYPDGSHGVTNRAFESRSRMADWMAARLTA